MINGGTLLGAFTLTLRFAGNEHQRMEEELIDGNVLFPPCPSRDSVVQPIHYANNRNLVLGVAVGAIFLTTSVMSLLEPCLPIWLMKTMKPKV